MPSGSLVTFIKHCDGGKSQTSNSVKRNTYIVGWVFLPVHHIGDAYKASDRVHNKQVVGRLVSSYSCERIPHFVQLLFIRANLRTKHRRKNSTIIVISVFQ